MQERKERLSELFRRHADDIHAYAAWRVGRHDAADIVGEVFLTAWRSLDRVRVGQERGWLFGVARTVVLARLRKGVATALLGERLAAYGDPELPEDRMAEEVARRDEVRRTLESLRESDREVLVMAFWFDLPPGDAARALAISRATYAVRLHRARARFRQAFERSPSPRHAPRPTPAAL
ncbi:sigma-70 family RNA polymerase sigma factor [Micromonospora sp. NPDC049559]|uniref:RNA polymerase sigma factor n=1 Tax=Micromonospora sp. NPDC049559 TaxID=3155923 RepID=UPI00342EC82F